VIEDLPPKHLNFQVESSSSSSSYEDNCEDVAEDSMPANSHHAIWAENYYKQMYACQGNNGNEEGLENLCDDEDDEMSLGNFYTDLEKQP